MMLVRHHQANLLEAWLTSLLTDFADWILPLDADAAQVWGRLSIKNVHAASATRVRRAM